MYVRTGKLGHFGDVTLPEDREVGGVPLWAWVVGAIVAAGVVWTAVKTK